MYTIRGAVSCTPLCRYRTISGSHRFCATPLAGAPYEWHFLHAHTCKRAALVQASPGIIVGAWRVFVIADVVANVPPSTAIYACGHPFSVCQRRPAQHRGELMCFGVPQSEGIDLMAGLPCCDYTRLGDFLRFARAVKHAAQSDAGLPESSTADVVSGGNVIVLLDPDSIAQAAARQCRTCCATKHSFGRPGAVVGAHIASAVLSPLLMARSTLRENHS